MTYNEAVESIRIINNLLKNDTLYKVKINDKYTHCFKYSNYKFQLNL